MRILKHTLAVVVVLYLYKHDAPALLSHALASISRGPERLEARIHEMEQSVSVKRKKIQADYDFLATTTDFTQASAIQAEARQLQSEVDSLERDVNEAKGELAEYKGER